MAVVHLTVTLETEILAEISRVERERTLAKDPDAVYWASTSAYLKALRWVLTTAGAVRPRPPQRSDV